MEDYLRFISLSRADAVIRLVNTYGRDVSKYPHDVQLILEMHVTNCYWSGMFGETGQNCSRCSERRRNHILNGKPCISYR